MSEAYRKAVLEAYKSKKSLGKLSPNLASVTAAKLRAECLIVYKERPAIKDDEILRLFFTAKDKDYTKGIEHYKIDGFKQLIKVLNGKEIKIGDKYIELLAWLIDFQPRPYQLKDAYEISVDTPKRLKIDPTESETIKEAFPIDLIESETSEQKMVDVKGSYISMPFKFSKVIFAVVSLVIIALIFYIIAKPKYMYWTGEKYETMAFYRKVGDTLVLEYDKYKFNHLKKITQPDTITENAVGRIWYVKVNSVDFYTSKGEYPLDTSKVVKPATKYIIDKYVVKKDSL